MISTLRPGKMADILLSIHLSNSISNKIQFKYTSNGLIDSKEKLVKVMDWCHQTTKPLPVPKFSKIHNAIWCYNTTTNKTNNLFKSTEGFLLCSDCVLIQ